MSGLRYVELQVTSPFSFLRGASSAEELFATAALMGIEALAVTDRNTLSGIVRAWKAAKATGLRLASETDCSKARGHSWFTCHLISASGFQNGGLNGRAAVCIDG